MPSLNKQIIIGNLGKDPEVKFLDPSGASCTSFSVAVNSKWKDKNGEPKEHTEWFNVEAWASLGETCAKYLKKGAPVYIEGETRTRPYERDGEKKYFTAVTARVVQFLSSREDRDASPHHRAPEPPPATGNIPF